MTDRETAYALQQHSMLLSLKVAPRRTLLQAGSCMHRWRPEPSHDLLSGGPRSGRGMPYAGGEKSGPQ